VTRAISLFYCLRIVFALYAPSERAPAAPLALPLSGAGRLATLTLALLWLGAWPHPFIDLVRSAVNGAP
jgi:NADH:ubiquinone oxidoreductase subunit 2 (subunit N)